MILVGNQGPRDDTLCIIRHSFKMQACHSHGRIIELIKRPRKSHVSMTFFFRASQIKNAQLQQENPSPARHAPKGMGAYSVQRRETDRSIDRKMPLLISSDELTKAFRRLVSCRSILEDVACMPVNRVGRESWSIRDWVKLVPLAGGSHLDRLRRHRSDFSPEQEPRADWFLGK
ncbi:hypothetical protein VTN77DRAFT_8830 [Rasamsonia byssochlamydoides]|uniref:uncharacterized protein n=1 Tax=Rasamsonia byssochlamydoides TaxID=89139 RepID=UPI0037420872